MIILVRYDHWQRSCGLLSFMVSAGRGTSPTPEPIRKVSTMNTTVTRLAASVTRIFNAWFSRTTAEVYGTTAKSHYLHDVLLGSDQDDYQPLA